MGLLHTKNKIGFKTLGPQAAKLVTELYEAGQTLFSYTHVEKITGLQPKSAKNFMASLVNRGVATRLKGGLFILVPYELGREREYLGNPFIVARELAGNSDYYLSHASAMDLHRMVTQPQLVIYTTTPRAIRPQFILGMEFRFIRCKQEHFFGLADHWVSKTEKIRISDLEKTVIDCLKQTERCGGFTEIAKGFWMRHRDIDPSKLVDYAIRLNIGAVIRRLGFLLELFEINAPREIERLHQRLTATYALLDTLMPDEGSYLDRWRLRLNVSPEEILAVVRT